MTAVRREYGLAAGHAHVARYRRTAMAAVDDEVMALRLAQNCGIDCRIEQIVALGGTQRRAQISGVFLPKTHIQRTGAGQTHAIARLAEIMRQRGDEAEP